MLEIWKDIPGYEGSYQASSLGQIRSLDRVVMGRHGKMRLKGCILRPSINNRRPNNRRYFMVVLSLEGRCKPRLIHRLVLETFVGPRPDNMETRHGPKGNLDNTLGNLCWGTKSENRQDCKRDGTDGNKIVYCSDGRKFNSSVEAAQIIGISDSRISACCRGIQNSAGGFNWSFEGTPGTPVQQKFPTKSVIRSDGKAFSSIKEAAKITGIHKTSIGQCCHGKLKSAGGFNWSFEGIPDPPKLLKKSVIRSDGKIFPSITEAERITGIDDSSIVKCCRGKYNSAGGFGWEYKEN